MTTECTRAGLVPVCYGHQTHNIDDCLLTQGNGITMAHISGILCGNTSYRNCQQLWGLFVAMKNHGGAEWGVMSDNPVNGKFFTSGPGHEYISTTKQGQYYALCGHSMGNVMDKINTEVAILQKSIGKLNT